MRTIEYSVGGFRAVVTYIFGIECSMFKDMADDRQLTGNKASKNIRYAVYVSTIIM